MSSVDQPQVPTQVVEQLSPAPPSGHPALFDREEVVWRGAARGSVVRWPTWSTDNSTAPVDQSVDQWWEVLPRRSRDQTQATRGDSDRPQGQLARPVLLPVC
jgi:hypothetical protein